MLKCDAIDEFIDRSIIEHVTVVQTIRNVSV